MSLIKQLIAELVIDNKNLEDEHKSLCKKNYDLSTKLLEIQDICSDTDTLTTTLFEKIRIAIKDCYG